MTVADPSELARERWREAREFLSQVNFREPSDGYTLAVVDSVLDVGADDLLWVTTSMHDLIVSLAFTADQESDAIVVSAPSSIRRHPPGTVRIDFRTSTGRSTQLVRPCEEAVPLFWRFVQTEFGLRLSVPGNDT